MDSLPQFLIGGTAEFILSEIGNKNHIRFKIKRDVKDEKKYWVRYKAVGDWRYIGYIHYDLLREGTFWILGTEPVAQYHPQPNTEDDRVISEIFRKFLLFVYYLKKIPSNLEVLYTGECCVCGRRLKDPIYIKIGIGKICLENKMKDEG